MLRFDILTIFPGMFEGPFRESMLKRAADSGLIDIAVHNIRDWATDRHRTTDDYPFGGGRGMVMKPEPIFAAAESILSRHGPPPDVWSESRAWVPQETEVILLSPQGRVFDQTIAQHLSAREHIVLICGHYEGVDERVRTHLATDVISIGDYVLTGGEIPAMVLVDCVARLVPGVLPSDAPVEESHSEALLEYPQYTRPAEFRGLRVPGALVSGHHANVKRWRRCQSLLRTRLRRPDLLERADLSDADRRLVAKIEESLAKGENPCE